MRLIRSVATALGCCIALASSLRAQSSPDSTVDAALQRYSALVERMANDSIAAMYLPNGELAPPGRPPIVGPTAIAQFLGSFSAYHVLSETMAADSEEARADTVLQTGHWAQRVVVPAGDTVAVDGTFTAEWLRDASGHWRLRRMSAKPRPRQG